MKRSTRKILKYLLCVLAMFLAALLLINRRYAKYNSYYFFADESNSWARKRLEELERDAPPLAPHQKETDMIDWHDYKRILEDSQKRGAGEQSAPLLLNDPRDADQKANILAENGFNGLASDRIALNRSIRDLRHTHCRTVLYQRRLPTVSLIIPFYNEHLSTLLRTVVSSLNRAPPHLIKEVILVDDGSTKPFLRAGGELEARLRRPENYAGKVRVLRHGRREGLIRTRIFGAQNATGDVLIFLDSHCEAGVNWLPPLLQPIAEDYRTVTCPFIDVLDADTFELRAQDEGARGAFDWSFFYKRVPLSAQDAARPTRPFESPVMAGGLFAISRKWFWELGGYDPGLDVWGGEQYELSFKLWQCGGRMLDVPCSRVGHVYRKFAPFPSVQGVGNFLARNYRRVAEVWMDEYKEFLYKRNPNWKSESTGDISDQIAVRKRLKCKPFKWFMQNVAYDLEKWYPAVEPPLTGSGKIRVRTGPPPPSLPSVAAAGKFPAPPADWWCMEQRDGDAKMAKGEKLLRLIRCEADTVVRGGASMFLMTWRQELKLDSGENCVDASQHMEGGVVGFFNCHGMRGNQHIKMNPATGQLLHVVSSFCLEANPNKQQVELHKCADKQPLQQWVMDNVNRTIIEQVWKQSSTA